jgi:hypothetical protein
MTSVSLQPVPSLPFLILDINVKLNFKATFINIMYAYLQPFRRNFNFLNNFFFIINCFFLNFYSKIALQKILDNNKTIKNKQI